MNCNEIVYERKMTGSFMKLRCDGVKQLDEKILLKNNIPGFLPMEKCYVNNEGQYWYDISGVQSLEMRCQYNDIKLEFLEKLVVSICDKMEMLWQPVPERIRSVQVVTCFNEFLGLVKSLKQIYDKVCNKSSKTSNYLCLYLQTKFEILIFQI